MKLSAVILAGGESCRMGCDKAWLEQDGVPLICRAIATVQEAGVEEVFISGREEVDYTAFHLPVLHDLKPGFGPLGGIERGLHAATSPLLLVLAVDLAQMSPAFLKLLADRCDDLTGVVPELHGQLEPLAAIYARRCHAIALDFLARSRRAARDFAEACHRQQAMRVFPVPAAFAGCLANWNEPSDVAA